MSFTSTATQFNNTALPSTSAPNNLLALFWDDLHPGRGGDVYYFGSATRMIVEWKGVPLRSSPSSFQSMQVHLYPTGRIEYHYLDVSAPLNSCTVGIQNASRNDGLQVVFNATYLRDSMAVRFQSAPPWLSAPLEAGAVAAGDSIDVDITFDATGLDPGVYTAQLFVLTNDLVNPSVLLPVTMEVVDPTPIGHAPAMPAVYALAQNAPNPFGPNTTIEFSLPVRGEAELRVYDTSGRLVRTLVAAGLEAGVHRYVWDGRSDRGTLASSGAYFYRLRAGDRELVRRMMLMR
jgi:hypothetical protein